MKTYPNKAIYKGYFRDGKFNGFGTLTFSNGDRYEGKFIDGKYTSKGIYTFASKATY